MDEAKTTPNAIAKAPPIIKNFSEGAVKAIVDSPESFRFYKNAIFWCSHGNNKINYLSCNVMKYEFLEAFYIVVVINLRNKNQSYDVQFQVLN